MRCKNCGSEHQTRATRDRAWVLGERRCKNCGVLIHQPPVGLPTTCTSIASLPGGRWSLRHPIVATLVYDHHEVVASWPEVEAWGAGATASDAVTHLKQGIVWLCDELIHADSKSLGRLPTQWRETLLSLVDERQPEVLLYGPGAARGTSVVDMKAAQKAVHAQATIAAQGIWDDLMDRRGIKRELAACAPAFQSEIFEMMRQSIVKAFSKDSTPPAEPACAEPQDENMAPTWYGRMSMNEMGRVGPFRTSDEAASEAARCFGGPLAGIPVTWQHRPPDVRKERERRLSGGEARPCPFCGGSSELWLTVKGNGALPECRQCGASLSWYYVRYGNADDAEAFALEQWNRRADNTKDEEAKR